jgi:hypothetical protein
MIRMLPVAVVLVLAGIMLSSQAKATGVKTSPSRIVMSYCTQCHDTQRICKRLGAMDRTGWQSIVERMIIKRGVRMATPEEKNKVINWLASQPKGAKPLCN